MPSVENCILDFSLFGVTRDLMAVEEKHRQRRDKPRKRSEVSLSGWRVAEYSRKLPTLANPVDLVEKQQIKLGSADLLCSRVDDFDASTILPPRRSIVKSAEVPRLSLCRLRLSKTPVGSRSNKSTSHIEYVIRRKDEE